MIQTAEPERAFRNVTVVRIPYIEGVGPCRFRNEAILRSPTPWIFLLDSDARPGPECLERLWRAAEQAPGAAAVSPRILSLEEPDRIHHDAGTCHFLGEMCLENIGRRLAGASEPTRRPAVASLTGLLVHRDTAIRCGLFDEFLEFFREDLDFTLRLNACGFRIIHEPSAVVYHARRDTRPPGDLRHRRTYYQTRNRWRVILKILDRRTLIRSLPLQLAYEAMNVARSILEGYFAQWLSAHVDNIRRIPGILKSRTQFQAKKRLPDKRLLASAPLCWTPEASRFPGALRIKRVLDAVSGWYWDLLHRD